MLSTRETDLKTHHRKSRRLYSLLSAMCGGAKSIPLQHLFFACTVLAPVHADADWPEFRGPSQNGVLATHAAPIEWNETEQVLWHTPTPGLGWSSPVIVGDRIYVTSARNRGSGDGDLAGAQSLFLECYSVHDGTLLLEKQVLEQSDEAPAIHKKNSHASPTIVASQGRLYLHFGHQGTVCTDLDGNIQWSDQSHSYPPVHGNGGSPILVGNKLILTCDGGEGGYTLALDANTGKEIWRTSRGISTDRPFSFCTPQWIEVDGVSQIISPGSNIVQSLAPDTGKVFWSVSYEGFSVVPRPVFHRGLVFVCTGYMNPKLLAIDPSGRGDVTETHVRWTYGTGVPNTPSLVPLDDQIVMVSDGGVASGVDIATGKKRWQKRLGGNYSASPVAVGNQVFFQAESGEVTVLQVGDEVEEVSKASLPGRVFASYAWHDGDWIIRSEQGLYRITKKP